MITKLPAKEQAKRDRALDEASREHQDQAAVIFMVNWMKRRGVPKDKLLDLTGWSDAERESITRIYKYSY
jgi:hypothetical protein